MIINIYSEKYVYDDLRHIPFNETGLVLGTSKYLESGQLNPYFAKRISACAELYRAKKIKYIIASGYNPEYSYNEPKKMKAELIKKGVPASVIYQDYAGIRTLDSTVRSLHVFGQNKITIISQEFHNKRAIFIARHYGIKAIGYNAGDVDELSGIRTTFREYFARLKVFIDLYITGKQPKFLGEKIEIK